MLDASGNASIAAAEVDNGSSDTCSGATLSVSPDTFNCSNIGANTVTLVVTDASSNSSSVNTTVMVEDKSPPTVSNITANPNPVGIDTAVTITAVITDLCSNISYAEYSIDGGVSWISMNTIAEQSNSVNISVEHLGFANSEVVNLFVKGVDVAGNESASETIYLPVYDPSAGFVTGGGEDGYGRHRVHILQIPPWKARQISDL